MYSTFGYTLVINLTIAPTTIHCVYYVCIGLYYYMRHNICRVLQNSIASNSIYLEDRYSK